MVVGTTSLHVDTIEGAYRLKPELSVGVLVVDRFVDGDDDVGGEFTVTAAILPRLQRLPNMVI